jgi:hypothetical protein
MCYSRCLRIATVIAAGIPNRTMTATSVYAMPVSHDGLAQVSSNAIAWQMTNATAARPSHLTCCRSSGPPARYRTASYTNATARNAADTPLIVPIRTTRIHGKGGTVRTVLLDDWGYVALLRLYLARAGYTAGPLILGGCFLAAASRPRGRDRAEPLLPGPRGDLRRVRRQSKPGWTGPG